MSTTRCRQKAASRDTDNEQGISFLTSYPFSVHIDTCTACPKIVMRVLSVAGVS